MPTTILDGETYEQARHRRFTEEAKVIEKMQQDEIIRMARDAGIVSNAYDAGFMDIFTKKLERFAALVAAHEREKQAEQEPVGRWNWNEAKFEWLTKFDYHKHHMTPLYAAPQPVKQEPVCWVTPDGEGWRMRLDPPVNDVPLGWTPLYATPVQQEEQEPVGTVGQLFDDHVIAKSGLDKNRMVYLAPARAVIAAYKEKNK